MSFSLQSSEPGIGKILLSPKEFNIEMLNYNVTLLSLSPWILPSSKVLLHSNKHIPNGTNLPTQPGQQSINNSRYTELGYVNHLGSAQGFLLSSTGGWDGDVGNPPGLGWAGHRTSLIPEQRAQPDRTALPS